MKPTSQWVLDHEMFFACLSRHGLSAAEIALAEVIAQPGQAIDEIAVIVRTRISRVRNAMDRRGLFAGIKVTARKKRVRA